MENKQDLFSYFLQFKNEPSVQAKKALTERICLQFKQQGFSEGEKNIVVEILSVLAKEAEVAVRKVLAETLKDDDNLPPSIAKQLAEDIEDVSIPILEFCRVLSERAILSKKILRQSRHELQLWRTKWTIFLFEQFRNTKHLQ